METYALLIVGQRPFVEPIALVLGKRYQVTTCETRRAALDKLEHTHFDLIILDLSALRFDAQRFYEYVRRQNKTIPFLFLLPRDELPERLPEAQEYLYHPLDPRRLQRVVKRILPPRSSAPLAWGGLTLETTRGNLCWKEKYVTLRPKAANLLAFLMQHPNQIFTRAELMHQVWHTTYDGDTRVLEVQVHWVRKALQTLGAPVELRAVRGTGYGLFGPQEQVAEPEPQTPSA